MSSEKILIRGESRNFIKERNKPKNDSDVLRGLVAGVELAQTIPPKGLFLWIRP